MRIAVFLLPLVLLSAPLQAQDGGESEGLDLMGEALKLFMRGLMEEMGPALDEMEGFLDNFDAYHPPEVLPNGDIIIRRKRETAPLVDGETEI